jgi:membrane protease subunit HflK
MRRVLPGGGFSASTIAIGVGILVLLWAFTGVYTVQTAEEGVVLRFGKYVRTTQPGLHYHLPYPIETVYTPEVKANKQINIGLLSPDRDVTSESLMLTGDKNIVNIHFVVFWQIKPEADDGASGAANYLFNVENPDLTVKAVAESAMREVIGRNQLQPIITRGREIVEKDTREIMQATLDNYGAGILITQVQLQKADPPDQVIDAFRDVVAAQQDQDRVVNEARAYANKIVPEARGEAQQIIQQAEAYRAQTVVEANGQAARFNAIYKEYQQAKSVTRERMFLETMERVLRNKNKVVIDGEAGPGVVPYLPLPEIQKRTEERADQ